MTIQAQNRSMRIITLGAGLIALIAVALLLADQLQETSATAGGPEMRLRMTNADPAAVADVCTESTCQLELGQAFKLGVDVVLGPDTGYTAAQTHIDFGPALIYDIALRPAVDEIVWPDCESAVALRELANPEAIFHGCLTGLLPPQPVSIFTGTIVEISVRCSAEDTLTEVFLRSDADPLLGGNGSAFIFTEETSPGFVISTETIPKVNTLTIICGEPAAATPLPTVTPGGPSPTPSATPTPAPDVTATPTPTPAGAETPTPVATTEQATATPVPRPCGDVNGDGVVNSQDALWVLWLASGVIDYIPFADDLDGDGTTGAIDALLILQIEANLFICR